MMRVIESVYEVALEAAPWLVLGLIAAGLIHAFLPPAKVTKWLGGHGIGSIIKAALLGAPLPLCSCGVLPVAVGLRKAGASRGATASFMVSTPETGVDSISVTYALMGPVFAVVRPIAAVVSAMVTGLLVEWFAAGEVIERSKAARTVSLGVKQEGGCCCASQNEPVEPEPVEASCCATKASDASDAREPMWTRLMGGQKYAMTRLIDDLAKWLFIGIVVAGLMRAFIDEGALARWGDGVAAYALMLVIGLPMYVCATASTPIAAAMLVAGVAPGPVLVFLMVGPATNIATLGVLKRELGARSIVPYVVGVGGVAVASGLALDAMLKGSALGAGEHLHHVHMVPMWLAVVCLVWLCFVALRPLRRAVFAAAGIDKSSAAGAHAGHGHGSASGASCCEGEQAEVVETKACCSHSS